jgi:hypothetical protein
MALTGRPDGPPLAPPPGAVGELDRLVHAIASWSAQVGSRVDVEWTSVLTARAALLGLRRQGRRSPNGTCRLLRGDEGWAAINLARPDDRDAVGAIVGATIRGDPWGALDGVLAKISVTELVLRARLLGVPAAALGRVASPTEDAPWTTLRPWPASSPRRLKDLRVVDLSSMWAGPLTAWLLARAGAAVVKVESRSRPDGARATPAFYRTLHGADQECENLDFTNAADLRHLRALVDNADIVIESSRPRALEQLGAGPDDVSPRSGRVWVSITGYGRSAPERDWAAFGDDAAVGGGLVAWEHADEPVFCGDAIADPLTGMHAAVAAFQAVANGGGMLLDVAMARCAASLTAASAPATPAVPAERGPDCWRVAVGAEMFPVFAPGGQPLR